MKENIGEYLSDSGVEEGFPKGYTIDGYHEGKDCEIRTAFGKIVN